MFARFSNMSFFFLRTYLISIWVLHFIRDFYVFWLILEFIIFRLMGIFFRSLTKSFSELFVYFIIQTVSSFGLLFFFSLNFRSIFFLCLILKLGIFPFIFWFIYVALNLPNFFFLMSSVVHKIPPFLIISLFGGIFENFLNFIRLIFLLQIRSLIGGLIIATSIDYRVMLIRSSVGSSSWFFLRSLTRYSIFISYLFFYLGGVFFFVENYKILQWF